MSRAAVVCDASALVAMLVDDGPEGQWCSDRLAPADLAAPCLAPFECANVLRRLELSGVLRSDQAALAHAELLVLPVQVWPHEVLAERAWELRRNLSCYDASYVALAELLDAPLVTLDRRIARSPGLRCPVLTP